ncbi:alpha-hydroxy acid oxidase [Neoroseomonas terrae]|uniref:alpha-hydroxy acid oxidase n=1 Tax=Neoroseomonas terrae TaxID=424799 RepID=UPI001FE36D94|nr:alpha-hydroxy acid oxidase [Neoroseomonas terrae]
MADVRDFARRRLPRGIFEFIDRGAEDDVASAENREAFRRIKLTTRGLTDVSKRSAATTLLGSPVSMPVAIAPTGAAGLVWVRGELELARAAAAAGVPFTLATRSMTSIEEIAEKAGGTNWFQLYVWADRSMSWALVDRAAAAGFQALFVTVDVPVTPNREYNKRNGFSLPFDPGPRAMLDLALHPRWLLGVMAKYLITTGMPRYENQPGETKLTITQGGRENLPSARNDNLTWDDIRELRRRWPRALVVKGILRREDALRAIECGADGVVVSNHGGRCLDAAVAPIDALPAIAEAVGGRATVLMDGGVRRGSDVVKALALGASGVLMGRPGLFGTALAGEAGARHVLDLLQRELLTVLAQIGCPTIPEIGPDIIHGLARAAALQVVRESS